MSDPKFSASALVAPSVFPGVPELCSPVSAQVH